MSRPQPHVTLWYETTFQEWTAMRPAQRKALIASVEKLFATASSNRARADFRSEFEAGVVVMVAIVLNDKAAERLRLIATTPGLPPITDVDFAFNLFGEIPDPTFMAAAIAQADALHLPRRQKTA